MKGITYRSNVYACILTFALTVHLNPITRVNAFIYSPQPLSTNIFTNKLNANINIQTTKSRNQYNCAETSLRSSNSNEGGDEASEWKKKADKLRQEAQELEKLLDRTPRTAIQGLTSTTDTTTDDMSSMNLRNKRILVLGANGRLGSMVCRYLLRNYPQIKELVAAVHTVSENSRTTRGYGRLSYEVGAEDGQGSIGAAWSAEDRVATFEYTSEMENYNLQNLRLMEVELLDPVQCRTLTEDVDCVIYCATDFNGNTPRAISGLNVAFLFRAIADPTKGRVEIEGLRNILEGITASKKSKQWSDKLTGSAVDSDKNEPASFVLVSTADQAFSDSETPFGSFKSIKREGEQMLEDEFPSLSKCILQMNRYDDNFVDENLDVQYEENIDSEADEKSRRKINRRDAARFAVDALVDKDLKGKKVEVWTAS